MSDESRGYLNSRKLKTVAISIFSIIFYFMLRSGMTPNRMQRDEIYVINDVLRILQDGYLGGSIAYTTGNGYAIIASILIQILGLESKGFDGLEVVSPLIGSLVLITSLLVAIAMTQRTNRHAIPWVAVGFPATIFIFGGFTIRLAESTHKKFTYALILLAMLAAYRFYQSSHPRKWAIIITLLLATVSVYNYIWAVMYSILIFIFISLPRDRRTLGIVVSVVSLLIAFTLPNYLPTANIDLYYIDLLVFELMGSGGFGTGGGEMGMSGGISAWPEIVIAGISFSSWFIYSSGVFLVAGLAGLAYFHGFMRIITKKDGQYTRLYFLLSTWLGFLSMVFLALGDLSTFKRIIVFPGAFGVMYIFIAILKTEYLESYKQHLILAFLIFLLLLGAIVASPRAVLNGDPAPYDYYAEKNEIAKITWWEDYAPEENCLRTHQYIDETMSRLVWGLAEDEGISPVPHQSNMSVVYSSGKGVILSCQTYK